MNFIMEHFLDINLQLIKMMPYIPLVTQRNTNDESSGLLFGMRNVPCRFLDYKQVASLMSFFVSSMHAMKHR